MQTWSVEEDKNGEFVKLKVEIGQSHPPQEKCDLNGYCVYKKVNDALSYVTSIVAEAPVMPVHPSQYELRTKSEYLARKCKWVYREN